VTEVAKSNRDGQPNRTKTKGIGWFWRFLFPKDILNLVYIAKSYGLNEVADYWEAMIIMNDHQKTFFEQYCTNTL
jgi:UDPglucose 6-dehydrogenase